MSPFGPYADFNDCVAKNGDKSSPEGFCAWLHHKIMGEWPSGMTVDKYPIPWLAAYDAALVAGKPEKEAFQLAEEAAIAAGFEMSRFGWVKQFQAPNNKKVTGVKVFAAGTWTDSAGFERTWTERDLDKMVEAFTAGVPSVIPLKCGHTSDEFNRRIAEALDVPVEVITGDGGQGQIALGKMSSLARKGSLLIADFDNVPEPITNLIDGGQYSTVSVEIEDTVGDFGPVITGVALLGAEQPAVDKATLERALVFGGSRTGARVLSFTVGEDIPIDTLRTEFNDIKGKLAEVIKGKRGAPLFRALFGNIGELFERMVGSKHSASGNDNQIPEEVRAFADQEYQGNIQALINWVGTVGFDTCVSELTGKPGITDPVRVCGWLKGQAHSKTNEGGNYQMDLKELAKMLGLPEEATEDEVKTALQAVITKAAESMAGGEMANELQKANDRIAALESKIEGQTSLAAWKERTSRFTAIPGTPTEHAVNLAAIEAKAGKEAAEAQFSALEKANQLAAEAMNILGTNRTGAPTDFDQEVEKYMKDNKDVSKADAIKFVSRKRPDLWEARRS